MNASQATTIARTCYRCKHCNGVLSISEFLERHCTACGKDTDVVASREKQA